MLFDILINHPSHGFNICSYLYEKGDNVNLFFFGHYRSSFQGFSRKIAILAYLATYSLELALLKFVV